MEKFRYEMLGQSPDSPGWWHVIDVFNHVDINKVLLHTSYFITPYILEPKYKYVIKSLGYEETPRLEELVQWCDLNPEVHFIVLGDMWLYDFPTPHNLEFVEYRFAYCEMAQFLELFRDAVTPVKNKKYKYKFSSLSHRVRQFRAVMTAKLLTMAKHESLISWHNENNSTSGIHEYLIESVKNMAYFKDLDWSFLHTTITPDEWNGTKNDLPHFILDPRYPAYNEAFINITNETFWFGWHAIDDKKYITPGPYLSEKTWKCVGSGTMFINTGQPFTYKFLKEVYGIPLNFDIGLDFDNIPGDIDRLKALCDLIDDIQSRNLEDLIESNIDACDEMQQWILQPGLVESFEQFNQQQNQLILNKISR